MRLIDQIRGAIDAREQDRADSKSRRLDYHHTHHPEKPDRVLVRCATNLTQRNWEEAMRSEQAEQAGRDIFGH